jgi:hypothetical protein
MASTTAPFAIKYLTISFRLFIAAQCNKVTVSASGWLTSAPASTNSVTLSSAPYYKYKFIIYEGFGKNRLDKRAYLRSSDNVKRATILGYGVSGFWILYRSIGLRFPIAFTLAGGLHLQGIHPIWKVRILIDTT